MNISKLNLGIEVNLDEIEADFSVDVSGLTCPVLGMTPAKILKTMKKNQIIEVTSSDIGFKGPTQMLAQMTGDQLLGFLDADQDGIHRAFIKKS